MLANKFGSLTWIQRGSTLVGLNELGREVGLIQLFVEMPMIQSEVRDKQRVISELKDEIKELRKQLFRLQKDYNEMSKRNDDLEEINADLDEMNESLRNEIKAARKTIRRLLGE